MPIFPDQTYIELAQAKARAETTADSDKLFDFMLAIFNNGMNRVWRNTDGLTPQQVFDGFGADAVPIVQNAGTLRGFILSVKPGTVLAAGGEFTVDAAGKITVTPPPPPVPAPEPEPAPVEPAPVDPIVPPIAPPVTGG